MRPEIYADLSESQRRGSQLLTLDMRYMPPNGPLLTALGNFLMAVEKAKLTLSRDSYGSVTAYLPPTESELEDALTAAKSNWDRAKQLYEACEISGTEPEDYTRHTIKTWADGEGLPLPWAKGCESE